MAFAEGSVGASYGWGNDRYRAYNLNAGVGLGLAYKATQNILLSLSFPNAFNAYLGYNEREFFNGTTTEKVKSFSGGLSSTVSLQSLQFGIMLMR
jgi:hypothetical protein